MEIGNYDNKSKYRVFQNFPSKNIRIDEKNIKFLILYNFTNISDQVNNLMLRISNNELILNIILKILIFIKIFFTQIKKKSKRN